MSIPTNVPVVVCSLSDNDIRDLMVQTFDRGVLQCVHRNQLTTTYRRNTQPQDIQYRRSGTSGRMCTRFLGGQASACIFCEDFFIPLAPSNCRSSLASTCRQHESLKQRQYERVREIEHGSFTPLVPSATGGMAPAASIAYKRQPERKYASFVRVNCSKSQYRPFYVNVSATTNHCS